MLRLVTPVLCLVFSGVFSLYAPRTAQAAEDPAEAEYWQSVGPITGSTTAAYTYVSFFNPSGSGRTMIAKRIRINSDAVAAATYQDLAVMRTSAASGGTLIASADIPKKNIDSANSIAEVRHGGVTTTIVGVADSKLMAVVAAGAAGNANGGRDYTFRNQQLVLQPGQGIALSQTAAGDTDQRIRMAVEWEEMVSAPTATNDYMLAYPRVENAAATDYKYQTLFNPVGSGKTALVSRLNLDVDCDTTAIYTNQIYIRRITAASAGTQIASTNIPKKHSGAATSVVEARRSGVTATLAGTADSVIREVTPCGAAGQPHAHREMTFGGSEEELVMQPGEGIAVVSSAAGDIDQLVRLSAVWSEEVSTPGSQGRYDLSIGPVVGSVTSGYNYASFFNPVGSGKTAIVSRIAIRADTVAAATAVPLTLQRVTAASAGTQIVAADIPKRHTSTTNSVMEVRHTGVTATKLGTAAARLISVNTPSAVGQIKGHVSRDFGDDEKLVLQPGEGVVLYQEGVGDIDHRIKISFGWDEEVSAPSSEGGYMFNAGPVNGSTSSGYNYISILNPSGSGKTTVFDRLAIHIDANAAALYRNMTLQRISAASAGTLIATSDISEKHTGSATSLMQVRTTGVTATKTGGANARINSVTSPGAAGTAVAPHVSGISEYDFDNVEPLVLQPGEGLVLYQEAAGDADFRVRLQMEWHEQASAPSSEGEYVISTAPTTGSTTADYVYGSLMNPAGSSKSYKVKRIEIRADRTGTLVAPGYIPVSVRRTTAASGGTVVTATDIPKKHTGTATSGADIRTAGPTVTLAGAPESRLMGVTSPGAVGQDSGLNEASIIFGDELMLGPGEGIALYQEATAGDTLMNYRLRVVWSEVDQPALEQAVYRWYANADNVTPGSALAAQDTAATAPAQGTAFRLRTLLHVSANTLYTADVALKLQYATRSGTCDTAFSGETYTDVGTASGIIRYADNAGPADGAALAAPGGSDPSHSGHTVISQSYEEANNFAPVASVSAGQDGMWDFALVDNSAPAGTDYCFRVVYADDSALDSYAAIPMITTAVSNTLPDDPVTLEQKITGDVVITTGGWRSTTSIKFTAVADDPDASDTLQLCIEADLIGTGFSGNEDSCGTGVGFSGTPVAVTHTLSGLTDPGEYHWQARVKDLGGLYSGWVSYDVNLESTRDFGLDTTAPTGGTVYDGTAPAVDGSFNDSTLTTLAANWAGISANLSGLTGYEYSIGITAGGTTVKGWTSTGTTASMTDSALSLQTSKTYYVNVRTTDAAGNVSPPISSNGQVVAPTVSFSVSPATIAFSRLNNTNSYTDSKTSTMTTSTNAYGGYVVRSYVTDILRASNNNTIGMFDGGSYASPDAWLGADTGFGYTSDDSDVQGTNKFSPATCAGGGPPPCYAPFSQTAPGDIVADHTASVLGTPITNQAFILTLKVKTTPTQAASTYNTVTVYSITPIY